MSERPIYIVRPDSLQEIKRVIISTPKEELEKYYYYNEVARGERHSFFGEYKDFDDLVSKLDVGTNKYDNYIFDNLKEPKLEDDENSGFSMSNEGFAYDMGSVIEGNPECCITQKALSPRKYIKIVLEHFAVCRTSPNQLANKAVAIANLINTLLSKGYIVDVKLIVYNYQGDGDARDYNDYILDFSMDIPTGTLNLQRLVYMFSSEFYRGISWLYNAIIVNRPKTNNGKSAKDRDVISKEYAEKNICYIRGIYNEEYYNTIEKANDRILWHWNEFLRYRDKENK